MDLNYQLGSHEDGYLLQAWFTSPWTTDQVWEKVATSPGIKSWFDELSYDDAYETLIFYMPEHDFKEEMKVLTYQAPQTVAFEWAGAVVTFEVSPSQEGSLLRFQEVMPLTFDNPVNDLSGWMIHMTRLLHELNGQEVPSIHSLKDSIQAMIQADLDQLS